MLRTMKLLLVMALWSMLVTAQVAPLDTTVRYYPNYKESVCKGPDRVVADAWSASNLLLLRVNEHNRGQAAVGGRGNYSEAVPKLIAFDFHIQKYYELTINEKLGGYVRETQLNDSGSAIDLIQSNILQALIEWTIAPSVLFFEPRSSLRSSCQTEWFYDPADSKFCRRHPLVTEMDRVLVIIENGRVAQPEQHQFKIYHTHRLHVEDFGETSYRHVSKRWKNDIVDLLRQYVTAIVLLLQVNNRQASEPVVPIEQQSVRYLFSNRLGLFVAWPGTPGETQHCAVLVTVKLQPHIRLCTQKSTIVSFLEFDGSIVVVFGNNRIAKLSHLYLKKQFRLFNNFDIDLDQLDVEDLFDSFFHCKAGDISSVSSSEQAGGNEFSTSSFPKVRN